MSIPEPCESLALLAARLPSPTHPRPPALPRLRRFLSGPPGAVGERGRLVDERPAAGQGDEPAAPGALASAQQPAGQRLGRLHRACGLLGDPRAPVLRMCVPRTAWLIVGVSDLDALCPGPA